MSECPICFKKANYTTECNHHFCKKCLYRWGSSCPLCRAHYALKYPNTRSMSLHQHVWDNTRILLNNIARVEEVEYKIKIYGNPTSVSLGSPRLCKKTW